MGDMSTVVLAAEEGGNNFLLPNGTFFFVLAIFLIVLGIIGKFVVPPILQVLHERDAMIAKTTEDSRKAAKQFDAAQADYQKAMADARKEATGIREDARAEGRKILDEMRGRASEESAAALQRAGEQLKGEADTISAELRRSAESLSAVLASRVVGVDIEAPAAKSGDTATVSGR